MGRGAHLDAHRANAQPLTSSSVSSITVRTPPPRRMPVTVEYGRPGATYSTGTRSTVLQGYNHVFERTDPIRDGKPTTVAADIAIVYPETDGTVYYTVGSAGRPRYNFQPGELETFRGHPTCCAIAGRSCRRASRLLVLRLRHLVHPFPAPRVLVIEWTGGRRRIRLGIRQTHVPSPGPGLTSQPRRCRQYDGFSCCNSRMKYPTRCPIGHLSEPAI